MNFIWGSPDILTSCVEGGASIDCTGDLRLWSKLDLEATLLDADGGGKEYCTLRGVEQREAVWQKV